MSEQARDARPDEPEQPEQSGAEQPGFEQSGSGLSVRDRAVLDVASRPWPGTGARDRAIRERLGMSPTAYLQLLNALLDDPRALAYAPVTVNRLRATREARRRER